MAKGEINKGNEGCEHYLLHFLLKCKIQDSKHFILPLKSPQHGEGKPAPRAMVTVLTDKSGDRTSSAHQRWKQSWGSTLP